jgi:hypothetical protein
MSRRPPLRVTLLRLAATAAVAAVLIWSLMYLAVVRSHAGTALAQPSSEQASPVDSRPAPTPVTTRTS